MRIVTVNRENDTNSTIENKTPNDPSNRERKSLKSSLLVPLLLLLMSFGLSACQTAKKTALKPIPPDQLLQRVAQNRVNGILKTAFSQVGNPYRYGGSKPETGFDCSGFVLWVYKQFGVDLPRSSRDMMSAGTPIDRSELRPGDLIFFKYNISHVGIYTGDNKYIHSPSTGKRIQESDLSDKGRGDHFVAARRVIDNRGVTTISEELKSEWVKQSRHQTTLALNDKAAQRHTGANARGNRTANVASNAKKKNAKSTVTASGKSHKVSSGDTIVDLAKRYGVTASDLLAANNIKNKDRHKLKIGQVLKIPEKKTTTAKAANKSPGDASS
ncbi:MAG: C40 family peptidase [Deltaproteobacteria bacterium]|jgi:LysM repeat protein|nr:C40 family peptidase [Deltaproteobacteria bacterium]